MVYQVRLVCGIVLRGCVYFKGPSSAKALFLSGGIVCPYGSVPCLGIFRMENEVVCISILRAFCIECLWVAIDELLFTFLACRVIRCLDCVLYFDGLCICVGVVHKYRLHCFSGKEFPTFPTSTFAAKLVRGILSL